MNNTIKVSQIFALVLASVCSIAYATEPQRSTEQKSQVIVEPDGTVQVPAYEVPLSIYMSDAAKQAYISESLHSPPIAGANDDDVAKSRATVDRAIFMPQLEKAKAAYAVLVQEQTIAGVRTEVVTPQEGVSRRNRDRILINLHGGGFTIGTGALQLVESIPIAGAGKVKVISIDYRLSPEFEFPAASEDVAAVYKELLKRYKPQNIGIYGSSAGGALAAMSMAWFQKEKLPRPGAIAMLSLSDAISGGDSRYTVAPLNPLTGGNSLPPAAAPNPPNSTWPVGYLGATDVAAPIVSPTLHPAVLAQFPPTLLVTGTRDLFASTTIHTHSQMVNAGVDAELHVWEGMWHIFYNNVDLPESKEMYEVTVRFFDVHLGKGRSL